MTDLYRIKPYRTLAWWVACSFFAFPLSILVTGVIGFGTVAFLATTMNAFGTNAIMANTLNLLGIPFVGVIVGFCVGSLQRWILRNEFYWAADRWIRWTVVGGIVGSIVVTAFLLFSQTTASYSRDSDQAMLFAFPIFLTIVSAWQVISLRHAVKQSWLWIAGNLVGGVVFVGILTRNQPSQYNPNGELMMLGYGAFAIVALGVITGLVMLFLFESQLLPMQPPDKASSDSEGDHTTTSVWDEAI